MKRFLGFSFAMLFALAAIALVGGDSGAVAGHGCHGGRGCHGGGLFSKHRGCHGGRERCHGLFGKHRRCHGEAAAAPACEPCGGAAGDCGAGDCGAGDCGAMSSGCGSCGGEAVSYGEVISEGGCVGGGCAGESVISNEVISEGVPTPAEEAVEAPAAPAAT